MHWLHWVIPITLIGPIASIYYVTTPIEHRIGGWFRELASLGIGLAIYFWLFAACSEHFAAEAGTTIAAADAMAKAGFFAKAQIIAAVVFPVATYAAQRVLALRQAELVHHH